MDNETSSEDECNYEQIAQALDHRMFVPVADIKIQEEMVTQDRNESGDHNWKSNILGMSQEHKNFIATLLTRRLDEEEGHDPTEYKMERM